MGWRQKVQQAAREFDWQQLADVVEAYVGYLRSAPDTEDSQQIRAILSLLREHRRYEELLRVADAALGHGLTDAAIKRQLAQALVDRDRPAAALLIFLYIFGPKILSGWDIDMEIVVFVVCLVRSIIDYYSSWDFYFPPKG